MIIDQQILEVALLDMLILFVTMTCVSCLSGFGLKLTVTVPQLINLSVAQIKQKCGFTSIFSTNKERKKKCKKNYKMLKIKA